MAVSGEVRSRHAADMAGARPGDAGPRAGHPRGTAGQVGGQAVRATPTGQLSPFGPWLQYPFGFFVGARYCWW